MLFVKKPLKNGIYPAFLLGKGIFHVFFCPSGIFVNNRNRIASRENLSWHSSFLGIIAGLAPACGR
jgi:hypothetical protein